MQYVLAPGVGSAMLPGVGVVNDGDIVHGNHENLVKVGLLVEVPGTPEVRTVLTEVVPPVDDSLIDQAAATVVPVADAPSDDDIPPSRTPDPLVNKNKSSRGRR